MSISGNSRIIPHSIQQLIDAFEQLPGIGPKTAQRLTFYLLRADRSKVRKLSEASASLFDNLRLCSLCCSFCDGELCSICQDSRRDFSQICVVGEPFDIVSIESSGHYQGVYHVLHGLISPLEGVGPEHLTLTKFFKRIRDKEKPLSEIIFATNPTLEGEATALYIAKQLMGMNVIMTRIARGLPTGGDLGYTDPITLLSAFEGRKVFAVA